MADQAEKVDLFTSLSEEEFAKLSGPSDEALKEALRLGAAERRAVERSGGPAMVLPQMLFR
jgi:hypothetical protein